MNKKKGFQFGLVQVVVLVLIAFAFVLFFFPLIDNLGNWIFNTGTSVACKFSLFGGKASIECLEDVRILTDKVEVNGKKFMEKGPEGTQVMAKEALAKLMTQCLSKGGGFNSAAFTVKNWLQKETVCLLCYKVVIDSEDVGFITDFSSYVRDTKAKGSIADKTYLDALTRDAEYKKVYMEYGAGFGLAPAQGTFIFKPFQKYIIFYIGQKKGYILRNIDFFLKLGSGDLLGAFFKSGDVFFTYIAEPYKIVGEEGLCNRLVN